MNDRLVCECYNIWVRDIKAAIDSGQTTFEDMEKSMKLGVMCSACIGDAKRVIAELQRV